MDGSAEILDTQLGRALALPPPAALLLQSLPWVGTSSVPEAFMAPQHLLISVGLLSLGSQSSSAYPPPSPFCPSPSSCAMDALPIMWPHGSLSVQWEGWAGVSPRAQDLGWS